MQPWPQIKEIVVTKIGWRTLITKTFMRPDGIEAEYVTFGNVGRIATATIALTADNKVVLAKQFRPGPEKIFYEIPGGMVDKSEDYEVAARRELLEETGYEASTMELLGKVYKDAYTNTIWYFYLARGCKDTSRQYLDDGEFVEPVIATITELFEYGRTGQMTDVEALFLAYDVLKNIQKEPL
jgi:ADP-ribose pyrophosphatase